MRPDPCDSTACDHDRRSFLRASLGSALGLALGGSLPWGRAWAGEGPAGLPGFGAAQHCIVLWLNGAPSQLETFDPKPGTPQGGPTRAIPTSAKGVMLAEHFPLLAEQMHRVALVRSMSTREGNHQRARYLLHTGYVPSGTVKHPDLGALVVQQRPVEGLDLPSYVAINGATPGPGLLGVSLAPLSVQNPLQPVANAAYPQGVDAARFERRRQLRASLDEGFRREHPGPETRGHEEVYQKADRMMHSAQLSAFDLEPESKALRDRYGRNAFGQGCLMARRLIEAGVRVAEVQLNGWDTHKDNFTRCAQLGSQLDAGFSTLLQDLAERELLDKTLIVCMGEFGRTPRINPNDGRDHFPNAWSLALAGGPIAGGRVVGSTTPDGMKVAERPVGVPELLATVFHSLGLDLGLVNYTSTGRPLYVVDEGGKPIPELLASA